MADSGHPPAELHERLLICRTIKLNAGAHGGHRRCCHAQMQKNAQNKPQIARLILCVHTTLQVYCNLFLTFCIPLPQQHRLQLLAPQSGVHGGGQQGKVRLQALGLGKGVVLPVGHKVIVFALV